MGWEGVVDAALGVVVMRVNGDDGWKTLFRFAAAGLARHVQVGGAPRQARPRF